MRGRFDTRFELATRVSWQGISMFLDLSDTAFASHKFTTDNLVSSDAGKRE